MSFYNYLSKIKPQILLAIKSKLPVCSWASPSFVRLEGIKSENRIQQLSIADEIRKMKDFSYLPMPTYLYIEKYGKGIENDMSQICQRLSCKDWVIFPVGSSLYRDNPICGLLREIEKKQEIGREFSCCICIELEKDSKIRRH